MGSKRKKTLITLAAGSSIGSGIALIFDKLWWKYMAMRFDNPLDHYSLGAILIAVGISLYKFAILRNDDDSSSRCRDR